MPKTTLRTYPELTSRNDSLSPRTLRLDRRIAVRVCAVHDDVRVDIRYLVNDKPTIRGIWLTPKKWEILGDYDRFVNSGHVQPSPCKDWYVISRISTSCTGWESWSLASCIEAIGNLKKYRLAVRAMFGDTQLHKGRFMVLDIMTDIRALYDESWTPDGNTRRVVL